MFSRMRTPSKVLRRMLSTSTAARSSGAPRPIVDSTSALDYKQTHRMPPPPLPAMAPRSRSAEEAVTNILYNTPPPSLQPFKRHVLNCLVQNEPGVLSRVSGILAGRGFNIDSLVVCRTEIRDLSRMCIVLKGQEGVVEQARRQLEDLVPVWAVLDYTDTPKIQRELLLVKVSLLGPEYLEDQLVGGPHHDPRLNAPDVATAAANAKYQAEAHFAQAFASGGRQEPPRVVTGEAKLTGEMPSVEEQIMAEGQAGTDPSNPLTDPESGVSVLGSSDAGPTVPSESSPLASSAVHAAAQAQADYPHVSASSQHPAPLTPSQALALRAQHMAAISGLAQQFGGRLVDVSENSAIVELAGKTQRVDAFLRLLSPYGILESARSGMMTLPRTPLRPTDEEEGPEDPSGLGVDASMLPPG